jgi:DNA-binding transcriptional MerR regulator
MVNTFVSSIVRGAGLTIGRNLVNGLGKPSKVSSNRYYERAENELEKALNFPIQGRSSTILGKCFNMYQEFESEIKTTGGIAFDLLVKRSKITYYTECLEKIKDCREYLELVNGEDENIDKLNEIEEKISDVFISWIKRLSERILTLKSGEDLRTARGAWVGYSDGSGAPFLRPLYIQTVETDDDTKKMLEIDNHLKNIPIFNTKKDSVSIWPILIGLVIGGYGAVWLIKTFL